MGKAIHVCHSLKMGGITHFVKSLINLNGEFPSKHDLLLINNGDYDSSDFPDASVFVLGYGQKGAVASFREAYSLFASYDAVMVHAAHPLIVLAAWLRNKPIYFFQHGMTVAQGGRIKRMLKRYWYSFAPRIRNGKVICSTEFARNKMHKVGVSIPDSIIKIIPFGTGIEDLRDKSVYGPANGRLRIGMAGNLVGQKRFNRVLESFNEYDRQMHFSIRIAGDGPEEERLRKMASSLDEKKVDVTFLGRVNDMTGFYSSIDLFVLPSKAESFGLVILEALLNGIPVAGFSDLGGALSLIEHGRNGFILENMDEMSGLWKRLSDNPEELINMHENISCMDFSFYDIKNTRKMTDELIGEQR